MTIETRCYKPGCGKITDVFGAKWCACCWYPGIDDDYEAYQTYREEGHGVYQSKLMVGWADPQEDEE